MHFRVFSSGQGTEWGYFFLGGGGGVAKISNIFWGCLKFLIYTFGEKGICRALVDWFRAYV